MLVCSRKMWWYCMADNFVHFSRLDRIAPVLADKVCERHDRRLIALEEDAA